MRMAPIIETPDATLALAVAGSTSRLGKVIACAYAGEVRIGQKTIEIWGYGGARSVETMNAFGICHALEEVYAEQDRDEPRIHIFAPAIGFMRFVNDHAPDWELRGGKNPQGEVPDAHEEWRRLWQIAHIGTLSVGKATLSQFGLKRVRAEAKRLAEVAHWEAAFNTAGIARQGNNFGVAK